VLESQCVCQKIHRGFPFSLFDDLKKLFNIFNNYNSMQLKKTLLITTFFAVMGISLLESSQSFAQTSVDIGSNNENQTSTNLSNQEHEEITLQNTSMSKPAPVRHPGQPPHEVVFALPLRDDGKVYSGTVTFTASKPIEVEVLHTYVPKQKPNSTHGEPYHAVLPGNNSIAITHLRDLVDVPIEINGTGMSSGSFDFAGNALVFHKTTGEPFAVTYTIDAKVKDIDAP
jgi:hypothetical protein